MRMMHLWDGVSTLSNSIQALTGEHTSAEGCIIHTQTACLSLRTVVDSELCYTLNILVSSCQLALGSPSKPPWTQILPLQFLELLIVALVLSIQMYQSPTPWSL